MDICFDRLHKDSAYCRKITQVSVKNFQGDDVERIFQFGALKKNAEQQLSPWLGGAIESFRSSSYVVRTNFFKTKNGKALAYYAENYVTNGAEDGFHAFVRILKNISSLCHCMTIMFITIEILDQKPEVKMETNMFAVN